MKYNLQKAFTLVELAIVLIIIGLITGGVVGAQSLIESANRSSVIRDYQNYMTAVKAFQLEYDGLPGDFKDGGDYNFTAVGSTYGDGDGRIDLVISWGSTKESHIAFAQLSDAEIIPGNYSYDSNISLGVTHPTSSYGNGGYQMFYVGGYGRSSYLSNFSHRYNTNALIIGAQLNGDILFSPLFTARAAKSIDDKLDDGLPGSGIIFTQRINTPWNTDCFTSNDATSSTYKLSMGDEKVCHLWMDLGV